MHDIARDYPVVRPASARRIAAAGPAGYVVYLLPHRSFLRNAPHRANGQDLSGAARAGPPVRRLLLENHTCGPRVM